MTLLSDLRTPAFVVELGRVQKNARRMVDRAAALNVELRPHVKTHKTIEAARLQCQSHETSKEKIVVSTLAEAQFFHSQGAFCDILYAVPLDVSKIGEVVAFNQQPSMAGGRLHVLLDTAATLAALVDYCRAHHGIPRFSVFLKVDTGYHRAGVQPSAPGSAQLARDLAITHANFVEFQGLYSHSGHSYDVVGKEAHQTIAAEERDVIAGFARALAAETPPILCRTVAVGATPSCSNPPDSLAGVTEIHPGNYIFYDKCQADIGSCSLEDIAVTVLTRVLAHYPDRNQLLVDGGGLAFSKDSGFGAAAAVPGYGVCRDRPELVLQKLSQEVGLVSTVGGAPLDFAALPVGTPLRFYPNHSCMAAACHTTYYVTSDNVTVDTEWKPCRGW